MALRASLRGQDNERSYQSGETATWLHVRSLLEWDALVRFCTATTAGATLGVVSGRRRQGKSYLLEALCAAMGGFYFAATEATEAESLRQLAEASADHLGMPAAPVLRDWEQAVDLLLALGRDAPVPVVLDEFPYLCASSPALPSIAQKALGPPPRAARGDVTPTASGG